MCSQDDLRKNIECVRKRIARAAARSGRTPGDIGLIAVSKTVGPKIIEKAIDEGITVLGENRVQELVKKYDTINRECIWHLIGHLQTNKVKYIIDKVKMIHSLDNIGLAKEIQKRAEKAGRMMDVLVQVNVSGEESKFGIDKRLLRDFLREISNYSNLKVKGLMTIAPYAQNPEEVRPVFRELKKLFIDISRKNIDNIDMEYLSMGMSNDFEVAIEEGSNILRIGRAIFGERC
ncbi:MAG: YggS family pyridoxal phosphate-dependent enzyme [Acetivibrionales bacterium]|jgi:pyridoxal phosphate enzyme (YggS family)